MMRVFIELPTWLGDTVMATPAIENLLNFFTDAEVTLIGSAVSIEVLKNHPRVTKSYVLERNYLKLYETIKSFDEFDIFFSFRGSFRSKFLKFFITSKRKYQFSKNFFVKDHQVENYNNFINDSLQINSVTSGLKLYLPKTIKGKKNKLLGINPGASYGNAKRWYPKEFADVAAALSFNYDIVIFGGPHEKKIALDIEKYLINYGVKNYINLADKTSIEDLMSEIENLDLFITGDSGPMHLAAAFQVPTVSIFGPTNNKKTSQWMNKKSTIVKKNLACQPCMKKECPLKHHNCMKQINSQDVLSAINGLIN